MIQLQKLLGKIWNVLEMGSQLTLVLEHESGKELLVPYNNEVKKELNKVKRTLTIQLADGLVDLYLNDHED